MFIEGEKDAPPDEKLNPKKKIWEKLQVWYLGCLEIGNLNPGKEHTGENILCIDFNRIRNRPGKNDEF